MLKFIRVTLFLVIFFSAFYFYNSAYAQTQSLELFAARAGFTDKAPLESSVANIINVALSVVLVFFLGLALYSGMRWLTARGNEDHVTRAKDTLEAAIIGLVIISISYGITNLVFGKLPVGKQNAPTDVPITVTKNKIGEDCMIDSDCESQKCGLSNKCIDGSASALAANGEICFASSNCASNRCDISQSKCVACGQDSECAPGEVCSLSVCKVKVQNGCSSPCDPGFYCNASSQCVSGCEADANCQPGFVCNQGLKMCEIPLNIGKRCGIGGKELGTCSLPDNIKGGTAKYIISGATCAGPGALTKVVCYVDQGKCASNVNCDGICDLSTNTCSNSKGDICNKTQGNYWAESFKKCMKLEDELKCADQKIACTTSCNGNVEKCKLDCKNKYCPYGYPACMNTPAINDAAACSNTCTKKNQNSTECEFGQCQKDYLSCMNSAPTVSP